MPEINASASERRWRKSRSRRISPEPPPNFNSGRDIPLATYLRRCLTKDPKQRVHDVADVRLALEGAFDTSTESVVVSAAGRRHGWAPTPRAAGLGVGLLVLGALVGARFSPVEPETPSPMRLTVTLPVSDRPATTSGSGLAWSPDGRVLVYSADRDGERQLFRRPIDRFEATPIPDTAGAGNVALSPDGQWVVFERPAEGVLDRVPVTGGPPQTLTTLSSFTRGVDWGDDDTIVYGMFAAGGSLMQIPAAGGEPTPLFTPDDQRQPWQPQILEEQNAVLFTLVDPTPTSVSGELHLLDRASGEHRLLLTNAMAGRVRDSGYLVFTRAGSLWAVKFDLARLDVVGTPVPLIDGVSDFAISDTGGLVYRPVRVDRGRRLVWVDRDAGEENLPTPERSYVGPRLSPDGAQAAVSFADDDGNVDVWLSDLARGTLTRLTTDPAIDRDPVWTRDGRRVVFTSLRNGQPELFAQAADGTGGPERLLTIDGAQEIVPFDWSADGGTLVFAVTFSGTRGDIGAMPMDGSGSSQALIETTAREWGPAVSPDGHWLAYSSDETGYPQIYVRRFPDMTGRRLVSTARSTSPVWSGDGLELLYLGNPVGPPETVERVPIDLSPDTPPSLRIGQPERLFNFWGAGFSSPRSSQARSYDVSPDDGRILAVRSREATGTYEERSEFQVVMNWDRELLERVPIP